MSGGALAVQLCRWEPIPFNTDIPIGPLVAASSILEYYAIGVYGYNVLLGSCSGMTRTYNIQGAAAVVIGLR